jgi:hypothetical protein
MFSSLLMLLGVELISKMFLWLSITIWLRVLKVTSLCFTVYLHSRVDKFLFSCFCQQSDYTHRIGRTGRAGQTGVAITFLSGSDTDVYYDLKQVLQKSSLSRIPPELANHEAAMRRSEKAMRQKRATED